MFEFISSAKMIGEFRYKSMGLNSGFIANTSYVTLGMFMIFESLKSTSLVREW